MMIKETLFYKEESLATGIVGIKRIIKSKIPCFYPEYPHDPCKKSFFCKHNSIRM